MAVPVQFGKRRSLDPLTWPRHLSLGDKLQRLALLSPDDARAIEILIDDVIQRRFPPPRPRKIEP